MLEPDHQVAQVHPDSTSSCNTRLEYPEKRNSQFA